MISASMELLTKIPGSLGGRWIALYSANENDPLH